MIILQKTLWIAILSTVAGLAQVPGVPSRVTELADGSRELLVTNELAESITAIVASARYYDAKGKLRRESIRWDDACLELAGGHPLDVSASRTFTFGPSVLPTEVWRMEVGVRALVLQNGKLAGEEVWIDRLLKRRQAAYRSLAIALDHLGAAVSTGATPESLADTLNSVHEIERQPFRGKRSGERYGVDDVFGQIVRDLRSLKDTPYDGFTRGIARIRARYAEWYRALGTAEPSVGR